MIGSLKRCIWLVGGLGTAQEQGRVEHYSRSGTWTLKGWRSYDTKSEGGRSHEIKSAAIMAIYLPVIEVEGDKP